MWFSYSQDCFEQHFYPVPSQICHHLSWNASANGVTTRRVLPLAGSQQQYGMSGQWGWALGLWGWMLWYSALLISRGHFFPNKSWKTSIARPLGRGMSVFHVRNLTEVLPSKLLHWMQYHILLYLNILRVYPGTILCSQVSSTYLITKSTGVQ